jgi:thiamine-phosphate pyrophosphorylase
MEMSRSLSPICFITPDAEDAIKIEAVVRTALEAGIRWVQYRRKSGTRRQLYDDAKKLRDLTALFGALFIVNDYADIALAVCADGVHIGQDDLPFKEARKIMGKKIIGVSTHNITEAVEADREGAAYIGYGSIFPTITKDAGSPKGLGSIMEIKRAVAIPVIAIGGITPGNVVEVIKEGCDGVAVSAGISRGEITANVVNFLYNIANKR